MTFEEFHKSHLSMDGYSQYTANDAWEAGRRAALEEAAKACDSIAFHQESSAALAMDCADAIRALSQKTAQGEKNG
ncbi:TPA: hypothetical protein ACKE3D_002124 [Burkholderia dolosa]